MDRDEERQVAATIFNHVWDLLEKPARSVAEDDEMIHGAHASRYHWGVVGQPVHWARGEWQCARVYAVLGRAEPALYHANRCLDLAVRYDLGPFDAGAAHEAIARASALAGDPEAAAMHLALGRAKALQVTDAEDRAILEADLDTLTSP